VFRDRCLRDTLVAAALQLVVATHWPGLLRRRAHSLLCCPHQNFDPFKRDGTGNPCDASGYYPGMGKYKDPIRPSVSFAEYQKQREEAAKNKQ
jgi:hypothetical protein